MKIRVTSLMLLVPLVVWAGQVSIPTSTKFRKVDVSNQEFYCLDHLPNGAQTAGGPSWSTGGNCNGYKRTIACYRCCVGEAPRTKEACEEAGFKNWKKGRDCGCP